MNPSIKTLFVLGLMCGVFSSLLAALRPLFLTKLITVEAFHFFSLVFKTRTEFVLIILFIEILDLLSLLGCGYFTARYATASARQLREHSINITLNGMARGDDTVISSFTSRMKTCSDSIEDFLKVSLIPTVCAALTLFFVICYTATVDISVGLLIISEALFLFFFTYWYGLIYKRLTENKLKADAGFLRNLDLNKNQAISLIFSGISSKWAAQRVRDIREVESTRRRISYAEGFYFGALSFILGIFLVVGYFVLISFKNLPISVFLMFIFYAGLMMGPIARVSAFLPEFRHYQVSKNLMLLSYPTFEKKQFCKIKPIRSVTYGFFVSGEQERVLIDGKSGSGKTRLLLSLMGLYPSDFFWGEHESCLISRTANENKIFYLSGSAVFASGLVTENFVCDLDKVRSYNARFKIFNEETLNSLLNIEIDSSGYPLSAGERQRLQLLRALIQDPLVLLMDEALSAVEEDLERNLLNGLFSEKSLELLVYVTHRNGIKALFTNKIRL